MRPAEELLPLEAAGEQVDEEVLEGTDAEDELITDRRQRRQRVAPDVTAGPVVTTATPSPFCGARPDARSCVAVIVSHSEAGYAKGRRPPR